MRVAPYRSGTAVRRAGQVVVRIRRRYFLADSTA